MWLKCSQHVGESSGKALSSISRVKITLYEINILFFIICVVSSRNFWFDVFHLQEGSH